MRLRWWVVAVTLLLTIGENGFGEIIRHPQATTNLDYRRQVLEYNRRTLAEGYKQAGVRDPRWDAEALHVLELIARRFSSFGSESWDQLDWTPTHRQVLTAVHHAFNAGCTDPLVLYAQAAALADEGAVSQARPRFRKAFEGIIARDYPAIRKAAAATRILNLFDAKEEPELHAQAEKTLRDAHLAMIRGPLTSPVERRIVFRSVWMEEYHEKPIDVQRSMFAAIPSEPDIDPWLLDVISGAYHIKEAWAARGSGWASSVTPEGWEGFRRNLRLAAGHLQAAWQRHPENPEAATLMIVVAMAGQAGPGQDERLWFDRAVAAQFDYREAYANLSYAMLPRWGGSHDQMYALGLECLATNRFDTRVPYVLIEILEQIARDRDGDWSFLEEPGIFEKARVAIERYVEAAPEGSLRFDLSTHLAMLAWKAKRYQDARTLLDVLGEHASTATIVRFDSRLRDVYGEIYLFSGEHAAEAQRLERLPQNDPQGLAEAWERLADRIAEGDHGRNLARSRAIQFRDLHRLARGETVEIQSLDALELVTGWWDEPATGRFVSSGLPNARAMAIYRPVVGQHYEFTGRYEILSHEGVEGRAAGIIYAHAPGVPWYELYPNLDHGQAILQSSNHRRRVPGMVPQTGEFVICVTGKKVADVWINGHHVTSDHTMVHGVEAKDRRVGLSIPKGLGHRVAYDQLRIRRLDVAPAAQDEQRD